MGTQKIAPWKIAPTLTLTQTLNPKPRRICIPVTLKMSIKTGLFSFLTFCCTVTAIFGIIDHYYIMENKKKLGKIKIKLITI